MRHDLRVDGHGFALRPVERDDAALIIGLRTSDPDRTRFLNPISASVERQQAWLEDYFARDNDYYWVVERKATGAPEGLVGIYDVDRNARTAEWGRWVLRPNSLAAVESALLIYRAAFEFLELDSLYCVTVADNLPVVSFHDSCGLSRAALLKDRFQLGDQSHDGIKHLCLRAQWPALAARLEPQAMLVARHLSRPQ